MPRDIKDLDLFKKQVKVVFMSFGSKESSAPRGGGTSPSGPDGIKLAAEALSKKGINAIYYVSPDSVHDFTSWKRSLYFFTPTLFQAQTNKKAQGSEFKYLDLQPRANYKIEEHFAGNGKGEGKLSPANYLEGVKFRIVAKYIHLGSTMLPEMPAKVEGIKVDHNVARLDLLHGTGWSAENDTVIGEYVVKWEDGTTATIPIRYGKEVLDWWYDDNSPEPTAAKVAWKGEYQKAKTMVRRFDSI